MCVCYKPLPPYSRCVARLFPRPRLPFQRICLLCIKRRRTPGTNNQTVPNNKVHQLLSPSLSRPFKSSIQCLLILSRQHNTPELYSSFFYSFDFTRVYEFQQVNIGKRSHIFIQRCLHRLGYFFFLVSERDWKLFGCHGNGKKRHGSPYLWPMSLHAFSSACACVSVLLLMFEYEGFTLWDEVPPRVFAPHRVSFQVLLWSRNLDEARHLGVVFLSFFKKRGRRTQRVFSYLLGLGPLSARINSSLLLRDIRRHRPSVDYLYTLTSFFVSFFSNPSFYLFDCVCTGVFDSKWPARILSPSSWAISASWIRNSTRSASASIRKCAKWRMK